MDEQARQWQRAAHAAEPRAETAEAQLQEARADYERLRAWDDRHVEERQEARHYADVWKRLAKKLYLEVTRWRDQWDALCEVMTPGEDRPDERRLAQAEWRVRELEYNVRHLVNERGEARVERDALLEMARKIIEGRPPEWVAGIVSGYMVLGIAVSRALAAHEEGGDGGE